MRIRSLDIALFVVCYLTCVPGYPATPMPVETLASLPSLSQPKLSPDGSEMIAFKPLNDAYHLFLLDLESKKFRLLMAADNRLVLARHNIRPWNIAAW